MLKSGIHATIAGVLMAVPLRHRLSAEKLNRELRWVSGRSEFEQVEMMLERLDDVLSKAHSPLHNIEHALAPYVAFFVMPVFAFFNAGVALGGIGGGLISAVSLGAFVGLLLGKPIGVAGFAFLSVRSGFSRLPEGTTWPGMVGIGLLAGIGFTMSLFIANLAFAEQALLGQAKIGVLAASVVASLSGLALLSRALPSASSGSRLPPGSRDRRERSAAAGRSLDGGGLALEPDRQYWRRPPAHWGPNARRLR